MTCFHAPDGTAVDVFMSLERIGTDSEKRTMGAISVTHDLSDTTATDGCADLVPQFGAEEAIPAVWYGALPFLSANPP
jgi:hypothetical protein